MLARSSSAAAKNICATGISRPKKHSDGQAQSDTPTVDVPQPRMVQHRPHPAQRAMLAQRMRIGEKTAETLGHYQVESGRR